MVRGNGTILYKHVKLTSDYIFASIQYPQHSALHTGLRRHPGHPQIKLENLRGTLDYKGEEKVRPFITHIPGHYSNTSGNCDK